MGVFVKYRWINFYLYFMHLKYQSPPDKRVVEVKLAKRMQFSLIIIFDSTENQLALIEIFVLKVQVR